VSWLSKVGSCQKPWLYPLFPAECIILKEAEKEATERIIFFLFSSFNFPFHMYMFSADPSYVPWCSTILEAIDLYT